MADKGELSNFPGVSAAYELPSHADLVLPTHQWDAVRCVDELIKLLESRGIIL